MLQLDEPDNFVVGTEETHAVREFCELAFGYAGLDYKKYVVQDQRFYRPAEVDLLIADTSKARNTFGWKPKTSFRKLIEMMVDADLKRLQQ
jgi:GDPmannose 4,6-dehydratase